MIRIGLALGALCVASFPLSLAAQDAHGLRARHAALSEQLLHNPFNQPLHVESIDQGGEQRGDVYAQIEQPFAHVGPALRDIANWCDILILPVNVKYCAASERQAGPALSVFIARRPHDPLEATHRLDLRYELVAAAADYLHVALSSPDGPFGTRNYRISLEAAPLDERRTFLHLSYAYSPGLGARLAMQLYLATTGRDKVGFSIVDRLPDGRPVYVDGVRGVIERNTMRYYLAVEAYLDTLAAPAGKRLEQRLQKWHAASSRYPQLRELERDEYVQMKRREVQRQRAGSGPPAAQWRGAPAIAG